MKAPDFLRTVGLVNSLVPAGLLAFYAATSRLGANPVEFFLRGTGTAALCFLLATLAVTPLRHLSGWQAVGKLRRTLGLACFGYAASHFLIYLSFDQSLDIRAIGADVIERPFVTIGFLALFFMVPLAATSTPGSVRRLGGKRWQKLHRRIYIISILAVTHFALSVKADQRLPIIYGSILMLLLGFRLVYAALERRNPPLRLKPSAS